ncbi:hypothetical protein AWC38_SpisGene8404 [Stylophora pistillata]|uniref:Uncharacterized protein n=1 Tax=Stylophora pistillata TaxID=50429 RepID=A0A2B4SER1_STYPI|nr:hypothetical protein AWC38_SpisGene8404 [Stylophora pistillata]
MQSWKILNCAGKNKTMTGLNSYHNSFYVQGHMGLLQMCEIKLFELNKGCGPYENMCYSPLLKLNPNILSGHVGSTDSNEALTRSHENSTKGMLETQNMILPILNMDVTPFVQFLVFVAYIGLIFGLSVELIGRNPLNMLRKSNKEEGSTINAEDSVVTKDDSAVVSEGSAIKNEDSVTESEIPEGNSSLAN